MALQRDTVSVSLAQSINEKIDDKVAPPGQMTKVQDCVFDKDGQLRKRYGQSVKATTVQGDPGFTNPVVLRSGTSRTLGFEHEDQLCQVNNGNLVSYVEGQNTWQFKGSCLPIGINPTQLNANTPLSDVTTCSGYTIACGGQVVTLTEQATGNLIASTTLIGTEFALRVIAFSTTAWVLTSSGTTLYARQVNLSTGALGSQVTLKTDFLGTSSPPKVTTTSASSPIGEAAFIVYQDNAASNLKVVPFLSNGTVSALGTLTTTIAASTYVNASITTSNPFDILCEPTVAANKLYIAGSFGMQVVTFTSSAYTTVFSQSYTPAFLTDNLQPNYYGNLTIALSPVNSSDIYVFVDSIANSAVYPVIAGASALNQTFTDDCVVSLIELSASGFVGLNTVYGVGYVINSRAISDHARGGLYLPVMYQSTEQSCVMLMTVLEGRQNPFTYCIGKCLFGEAQRAAPNYMSNAIQTDSATKTFRAVNASYLIDFVLLPELAASSEYIAKTSHLTGGLLQAYDGINLTEHGFLVRPEHFQGYGTTTAFDLTVDQVGDASHKEQFHVSFKSAGTIAYLLSINAGASPYFRFNYPAGGGYIWYKIGGAGADPSIGGLTSIRVDLNGFETSDEIAYKSALAATNAGFSGCSSSGGSFRSIANANGAVTAPSTGNASISVVSGPSGNYQYSFVYKWTDRNGHVYRSTTSDPLTISIGAGGIGSGVVWVPPITNRTVSSITLEIYRTQSNGSVFFLLATKTLSASDTKIVFYDAQPDTFVGSSTPILYTDGGVLDNYNVGACTSLSTFKNRLMVVLSDDPTAIYYSKTNVIGEPMNFAAETQIRYDDDGLPVTAHAQMDDKLVALKRVSAYVTAGDGANDLGQNETFQLPMRIPGDIGCINPNSLISSKFGLIFQSDGKGIYGIGRDLTMSYVGAPVDDYKNNVVSGAVLCRNYDHIVFSLQDSTTSLVYNQLLNRWDVWTNQQGDSSCLWQGSYVRATNSGKVYVENGLYYDIDGSNLAINRVIETVWLKMKGLQNFQRVYDAILLGEYKSPHILTVTCSYDFDPVAGNADTHTFDATAVIGGGGTAPGDKVYQVIICNARQKCDAIKYLITETSGTGTQECAIWNALDIEVGLKMGLNKLKAEKSV